MVVLLADPAVRAVLVAECHEALVSVRQPGFGVRVDHREADTNDHHGLIRAGVLARLAAASRYLPSGVVFLIIEGYRPPLEQDRRYSRFRAQVAESNPNRSAEWVDEYTSRFVSPVDVAPHCTGGAVDLTLALVDGTELDMGGAVNAHRHGDEASCAIGATAITAHASENRRLMSAALAAAGLVNYPTEWWHWSYGDKYWAHVVGAAYAVYGSAAAAGNSTKVRQVPGAGDC